MPAKPHATTSEEFRLWTYHHRGGGEHSRLNLTACLALAAVTLTAGVANATTIQMSLGGVFSAGQTDTYGYLTGTAGTSLAGVGFSYTASWNPSAYSSNAGAHPTYTQYGSSTTGAMQSTLSVTGYQTVTLSLLGTSNMTDQNIGGSYTNVQLINENTGASQPQLVLMDFDTSAAWVSNNGLLSQTAVDSYLSGILPNHVGNFIVVRQANGSNSETLNFGGAAEIAAPEPASIAIFGTALVGLAIRRRAAKRM
ncbi:MAG: PEP-CTERM sorting domain-containing protein [Rhodospirillales bacterium]|jgi:hypothetical protein